MSWLLKFPILGCDNFQYNIGMKYSVIVPHFNDFQGLKRLFASIPLNRRDLEILVIDDCSSNLELLRLIKAGFPNIRWFSTRENSGAGVARNIGLNNARGQYILFADSDDVFLESAFDHFDAMLEDDDQIVYFLLEAIQEVGGLPSVRADRANCLCISYHLEPTLFNRQRLVLGHVNPVGKIYSARFLKGINIEFDPVRVGNDVSFNVLAAVQADRVRVVPVAVYRIIRRNSGLTSRDDIEAVTIRLEVLSRLNSRLKGLGFPGRMHAGSYLYRALLQGPIKFFQVLCKVIEKDLLFPTIARASIKDLITFSKRFSRYSRE